MNTTENQTAPETVTAAGVVSSAGLGSFALHPLHLGYAYARYDDDEWWHGVWDTPEEAVAHLLSEDWEQRGFIAPVRAVTDADEDADPEWAFVVYGPRHQVLPHA
jgi:hypothetical protein